jgi:hypothetical protein
MLFLIDNINDFYIRLHLFYSIIVVFVTALCRVCNPPQTHDDSYFFGTRLPIEFIRFVVDREETWTQALQQQVRYFKDDYFSYVEEASAALLETSLGYVTIDNVQKVFDDEYNPLFSYLFVYFLLVTSC